METLIQDLRQFVIENFLFGDSNAELENADSFIEKGIIDSTGVMELVAFLESRFEIRIEDSELVPENLDSIDSLSRFVGGKLAEAGELANAG